MNGISGRLSELALVRMHGRAGDYLVAKDDAGRASVVAACLRQATVPDIAERILERIIYAQSSSRTCPLRELLQNALDASPRGARIDVRSGAPLTAGMIDNTGRDREIVVAD